MERYCNYEPGRFDDKQFTSTPEGFIHEVSPRHFARTGSLVHSPPVIPSILRSPLYDLLVAIAEAPSKPLGETERVRSLEQSATDEGLELRLEILRLSDRLALADLRWLRDVIQTRLSKDRVPNDS